MSDTESIAKAREEFVSAFNRPDIEKMADLLADDHIGMPPNQPALVGIDASRSWWKEGFDAASSRLEISPQELEIAGSWAFDRFDWTMETTPTGAGETVHDNGKCVWIWRREPDGAWKLARAIWNSNNEATGVWSGAPR